MSEGVDVTDSNLSPVATEANIAEIQARAAALGLVIATRCTDCGAPLFDPKSISLGVGPVCRAKHTKNDPAGTLAKESTSRAA